MAESLRVIATTANHYFKNESNLTIRRRLLLRELAKRGNILYNRPGHVHYWNVRYKEPEVRTYGDEGDQQFISHNSSKQLSIDVAGYTATDKLSQKQYLMNKGQLAIKDLYKSRSSELLESVRNKFCKELYVDGYATGNENKIKGIESCLGNVSITANDKIAAPSDTYGGLSTVLGTYGGSWSTDLPTASRPNAVLANDWPLGNGSSEYDFLAPKLINYGSNAWTGTAGWSSACSRVLHFATIHTSATTGDESAIMCHLLSADLYEEFANSYRDSQRIIVSHNNDDDLGFGHTLNFEGSKVKYEYDIAGGVGYGLCPDKMELFSLQSQLFVPDGPEWDITTKSYLFEVGFFGNMRMQPKFIAKYANYE